MTNNIKTNIEKNVMRRVHAIRILRMVFSGVTASCLLLLLALYGIGREVWVAHVFKNAPVSFTDLPRFYLAAFDNTRFAVQVLTVLTLTSAVYLVQTSVRTFSNVFTTRYA